MHVRAVVIMAVVAGSVGAPVSSQNLLQNPSFHSNVGSWGTESGVTLLWSPLDASAGPGSGSAEVLNSASGGNDGRGISQCVSVAVVAGGCYEYGGSMRIPSGQDRTGSAEVGLRWYDGPGCTGSSVGPQPRLSVAVLDSWVHLVDDVQTAPSGAVSVLFLAFPSKVEPGGGLIAHFDDLFLRVASIFEDGFEDGDASAWSATTP